MDTVISGRAALGSRKEVNDSLHFVKSRTRELNDEAKIVGDIYHHIFCSLSIWHLLVEDFQTIKLLVGAIGNFIWREN